MAIIWVGISRTLGFSDLITRYIDPLFSGPPPFVDDIGTPVAEVAELVRTFGAPKLGPGDFEVYDCEQFPGESFDCEFFARIAPFRAAVPGLESALAISEVRSMFFVIVGRGPVTITDRQHTRRHDDDAMITDVLDVKLDWE